jgi:integrase
LIDTTSGTRGIVRAAEKAGLLDGEETITTHDLRRTFISRLIVASSIPIVVFERTTHL